MRIPTKKELLLLAACEHAARSNHQYGCPAASTKDQVRAWAMKCTCHVGKASEAIRAAEEENGLSLEGEKASDDMEPIPPDLGERIRAYAQVTYARHPSIRQIEHEAQVTRSGDDGFWVRAHVYVRLSDVEEGDET